MDNRVNFAWPVTTLCKFNYDALKHCIEGHEALFRSKQIVIFGAGIRGTSFSLMLEKFGFHDLIFTDNNEAKVGGTINEYPIVAYEEVISKRNHIVIIISIENGFSIKEQLNQSGFVENENYFYIENHLYDLYLREFWRRCETDTLILGDCGLTNISNTDLDFTNLGEMLKGQLGENTTKVLAVHGMGMRAFYHVLSAQMKYVRSPRRVVLTANPEIFTGKQHLLPRSQHARLMQMLSNSISPPDAELQEYAEITRNRFEKFQTDYFTSSKSTLSKMSKERNDGLVIQMNYMYELDENNECIVYMKKLIQLCKGNGIEILLYIPPVNYEYAQELRGTAFTEKYHLNIMKLKGVIQREGAALLDLSFLLGREGFADVSTIDETTNFEGRKAVMGRILAALPGKASTQA